MGTDADRLCYRDSSPKPVSITFTHKHTDRYLRNSLLSHRRKDIGVQGRVEDLVSSVDHYNKITSLTGKRELLS